MTAFIPDVPYHIQLVFILTFLFIWVTAFKDDYLQPMSELDDKQKEDNLRENVWRGIYAVIAFMCAFGYLKPYLEYGVNATQQRINRVILTLTLLYMSWLIFNLHLRPTQARELLGFLDTSLNKPVTAEMHTYDDNCEFEFKNIWDNADHYYAVHLGNWFLASFVIRDAYILHFW